MTEFEGHCGPTGPISHFTDEGTQTQRTEGACPRWESEEEPGVWHLTQCLRVMTVHTEMNYELEGATQIQRDDFSSLSHSLSSTSDNLKENVFFSCTDVKLYFPDLSFTVDVKRKNSKRRVLK